MATTTPIPMLDLMFFLTESIDNPRHVGSVMILRKPKHGGEKVVEQVVEAYRTARPKAPFNRVPVFRKSGLPLWRELDEVDGSQHVRHLALPAPGSNEQLHELVADLHAPMLERHRPGWRVYVIDGLEDDRFAIYHKCHHALVDGESGMEILRRSLSESPTDRHHPHRGRSRPPVAPAARPRRPAAVARARSPRAGSSHPLDRRRGARIWWSRCSAACGDTRRAAFADSRRRTRR